MAQGSIKLGTKHKSAGAQKRKAIKAKTQLKKGRKQYAQKEGKVESQRDEAETTKAINRKNEALVAAKAVNAGAKFFLGDIAEKGKKEVHRQNKERHKKETKSSSRVRDRLQNQLNSLQKDL